MDAIDKNILTCLQTDSSVPLARIAAQVGLSQTPCWRRIQKLEEAGIIRRRVALLDGGKVNAGVTVFVSIRANEHTKAWLESFDEAVADMSEVMEAYRMSGDVDYLLRVVVPDIDAYDAFYKALIERVSIADVSSTFAMEQMKYTTALPLDYL